MRITIYSTIVITICLLSCRNENKDNYNLKVNTDSISVLRTEIKVLNQRLIVINGNLVAAKDKLNEIMKFHFGRTTDERESQIRDQTIIVQQLENDKLDKNEELAEKKNLIAEMEEKLK